mmetsp:Transcript_53991/g.73985  ORF Transcript_53991/g.73985 Transcript_53991/m.73985 type:complete len:109 (+) Transcript_53991:101-427(+)
MASVADLQLIDINNKPFVFFDGFESRSAGGGRPRAPRPGEAGAGPQKTQVLYSVRYVQAPKDKGSSAAAPRSAKKEGEVKKMTMAMEVPKDGVGNCAVPVRYSGALGL